MKSRSVDYDIYVQLVLGILSDNPTDVSPREITRDKTYVLKRWQHEGDKFLSTALPSLWKAVQLAMETGSFKRPAGFKPRHLEGVLPAFLHGTLRRIFNVDGTLLPVAEVNTDALRHVFQVCYLMYKAEFPYTTEQEAAVVEAFVQTEGDLYYDEDGWTELVLNQANDIVRQVVKSFDPMAITPRHGPGAVATGEKGEEKWGFSRLYLQIHRRYPYLEYFGLRGMDTLQEYLDRACAMDVQLSGCAKVVLVPKDSRGPRLISAEPLEYQFIQQGLGRALVRHLEKHPLTSGNVNFTDQTVNQNLALHGSKSRATATLDLEAASDRVSLKLVQRLFSGTSLLSSLEATRTTATLLPNGKTLGLSKFAPMGSALCFPVESLSFWALIVAAVVCKYDRPLNQVAKEIYAYGDDIVVPTEYVPLAIGTLEAVKLKVNRQKSCVDGPFRESCGMNAFHGVQITPVKVHTLFASKRDPRALAAYAAAANQLAASGYKRAAAVIWRRLERLWGSIPWGVAESPFVCRVAPTPLVAETRNKLSFQWRWSYRFQRLEFLLPVIRDGSLETKLDGVERLFRDLVSPLERPDRVPDPRSTKVDRRWVPIGLAADARRGYVAAS